jgi:hypothetical protein
MSASFDPRSPAEARPMVLAEMALRCYDERGHSAEVLLGFAYRAEDPYAVAITFALAAGDGDIFATWLVGRPLLRAGMSAPSGDGDVRIYPSIDEDGRAITVLEFVAPGGFASVHADTDLLRGFVDRTTDVVPFGSESDHIDLEALVADLLPDGA